jgi:hypothetical protein
MSVTIGNRTLASNERGKGSTRSYHLATSPLHVMFINSIYPHFNGRCYWCTQHSESCGPLLAFFYLASSLNYNLACAALPISNAATPASLAERHLNSKSSELHAGPLVDSGGPSFVVVFICPFCAYDSHH